MSHVGSSLMPCIMRGYTLFLALVLPDQVSESIIQFSRVKPLAGPGRPDMESQWLTPFKTEIFCNPKSLTLVWRYSSMGPNRDSVWSFRKGSKHEVCDHNNENKTGIFPRPCRQNQYGVTLHAHEFIAFLEKKERKKKKKDFFERDVPHSRWCRSVMETQAYKTYER